MNESHIEKMNESHIEKLIQFCNDSIISGEPQVVLKLFRKLTGKTARILPGVTGRVVQWGNEVHPSVVMVDAVKLKVALERLLQAAKDVDAVGARRYRRMKRSLERLLQAAKDATPEVA